MVNVPLRGLQLVLAATEYDTLPLPVPLVAEVIKIQVAPLLALQAQVLLLAVKLTVAAPPAAVGEALVGERVNVQAAAPA